MASLFSMRHHRHIGYYNALSRAPTIFKIDRHIVLECLQTIRQPFCKFSTEQEARFITRRKTIFAEFSFWKRDRTYLRCVQLPSIKDKLNTFRLLKVFGEILDAEKLPKSYLQIEFLFHLSDASFSR